MLEDILGLNHYVNMQQSNKELYCTITVNNKPLLECTIPNRPDPRDNINEINLRNVIGQELGIGVLYVNK